MTEIIIYTSVNCGPCRKYGPIVEQFKQNNPHIEVTKISTDDPSNRLACSRAGIRAVPCTLIFVDGREVSRFSGYRDLDFLTTETSSAL